MAGEDGRPEGGGGAGGGEAGPAGGEGADFAVAAQRLLLPGQGQPLRQLPRLPCTPISLPTGLGVTDARNRCR